MLFFCSFVIGACIGSFINVVVYRLPRNESVITPRSHCSHCDYQLKWHENVPLISWIVLKAKCSSCKREISPSYFLIELFCACFFYICNFASPTNHLSTIAIIVTLGGWLFSSLLLSISLIDFRCFWIPESIIRIGILTGFGLNLFSTLNSGENSFQVIEDSFIGSLVGLFLFLLIRKLANIIFKKPALGMGDAKLASLIGAWLGVEGLIITIHLTFLFAGFVVMFGFIFSQIKPGQAIPLGPFLSLGAILVWLFGNEAWMMASETIVNLII